MELSSRLAKTLSRLLLRSGGTMNMSDYVIFWKPFAYGFAIISTLFLLVIAWLAYSMNKARQLEAIVEVLKYVENLDIRKARWFYYEHAESLNKLLQQGLPFMEMRKRLDEEIKRRSNDQIGLHQVEMSLNIFNNIAFLINHGLVPRKILPTLFRNTFLNAEQFFWPYIKFRREHPLTEHDKQILYASQFAILLNNLKKNVPK